jgi:prophage regulatory protein
VPAQVYRVPAHAIAHRNQFSNDAPIALRRIYKGCIMAQRIIRLAELASTKGKPGKLPVSPDTIWRWVRSGKFPAPFKLSARVTVWDLDRVEAFIAQRADGAA